MRRSFRYAELQHFSFLYFHFSLFSPYFKKILAADFFLAGSAIGHDALVGREHGKAVLLPHGAELPVAGVGVAARLREEAEVRKDRGLAVVSDRELEEILLADDALLGGLQIALGAAHPPS